MTIPTILKSQKHSKSTKSVLKTRRRYGGI